MVPDGAGWCRAARICLVSALCPPGEGATTLNGAHDHSGDPADVIGSALDLHETGNHVVHALGPDFCDAVSVYLLERWVADGSGGTSADAPQVEARRLALRVGAGLPAGPDGLPIDQVLVFPRDTPYARALSTGDAQILDAFDPHTTDRLAGSGPADDRIDDLLRTTTSFVVVPLLLKGEAIGFVAATRGPRLPLFTVPDTDRIALLAARAAVALDNARRYEHERRTALAIRRSLVPVTGVAFDGCRVAHGYRPAGRDGIIGGDWYDVFPRPGRRTGLIVGDAMGHGPEAAVAMIQLRMAARTLAGLDIPPGELLRRLDDLAVETPGASFATCTYVEWDAELHTCTVIGAGHPPALVRESDEPARPVTLDPGLPLGLLSAAHAEPTVLKIDRPTLLLLYSDGVVETRHSDIDTGIEQLGRALDTALADQLERTRGPGEEAGPADLSRVDLQPLCDALILAAPIDATCDDRTVLLAELTPLRP